MPRRQTPTPSLFEEPDDDAEDEFEEMPWPPEEIPFGPRTRPAPLFPDVEDYVLWKLRKHRDELQEVYLSRVLDKQSTAHLGEPLARAEEALRLQMEEVAFEVIR